MKKNIKWFVLIIMVYLLLSFSIESSQASRVSNNISKYSHTDGKQRINMNALRFFGLDEVFGTNWLELPSLTTSRYRLASVGTNDHIYAIGGAGTSTSSNNSVEMAHTNPDGSIGSWQNTSPMTTRREGPAAVFVGDRIYVFGGITFINGGFDSYQKSVEHVDVNSDGSLGSWKSLISMNETRAYAAAVTNGTRIYVIGGENINLSNMASVEFATIKADGSLDTWQLTSSINTPRSYTTAVISGDNIYVVGGSYSYAGDNCLKTVERAVINENGSLRDWEYMTSLNQGRYGLSTVVIDGYIYALGGFDCSAEKIDSVERARIKPDGSLSNWEMVMTMSRPRGDHSAVANAGNRHIYVIGGLPEDISKSVEAIPIDAPIYYGLSINNGALFTNQISVSLSLSAPYTTVEMQVSNDGGFAGAQWEPYEANKNWSITQYGSYVIPRVVYVRFKDVNGDLSTTYQDDIILDVNAPTGSVEVVAGVSENSPNTAWTKTTTTHPVSITTNDVYSNNTYFPLILNRTCSLPTGPANVTLYLQAVDDVSGVADMLISHLSDCKCGTWESYSATKAWYVPAEATVIYVKFRDHAGNISEVVTDTIPMSVQ